LGNAAESWVKLRKAGECQGKPRKAGGNWGELGDSWGKLGKAEKSCGKYWETWGKARESWGELGKAEVFFSFSFPQLFNILMGMSGSRFKFPPMFRRSSLFKSVRNMGGNVWLELEIPTHVPEVLFFKYSWNMGGNVWLELQIPTHVPEVFIFQVCPEHGWECLARASNYHPCSSGFFLVGES